MGESCSAKIPEARRLRRRGRIYLRTSGRSYTSPMELRDGDLALRPWTEDDVDAIVEGCNDPEIAYWIPLIPSPYTADDA
ncbi:MAG TPA: GNAT family N-acetyltransferase, partial [Anaerolineales bacterium]